MKRNYASILNVALIAAIVFWIFLAMMPKEDFSKNVPMSEFSTNRALQHIKSIASKPHYVGSENHKKVAKYIENQLFDLGLETKTEDGFTLNDGGILVKSHNILARIKGSQNSKCLLLLSHYDSAPHSKSKGASDDASGVATILEGIRAFLHNNTSHKNDIIILFTDAEELGLNGAAQFVTQNKWAKQVGLAINFEARGSSGPSYMLVETNEGNAKLIQHFKNASPKYPTANSLMYSIYKMLPNDTDLTVFREQGNIQGFNFAFIDNHFNYHTAQDTWKNLDKNTLSQQGSYLMPLLTYFANTNLKNLNTKSDEVYFNTPVNFVSYPFQWNLPLTITALAILILLIFVGLGKRILNGREMIKGFFLFLFSLTVTGLSGFLLWKTILLIYPQYKDILHGFTYNGHYYIYAFVALALAINFWIYASKSKAQNGTNHFVAPLLLWIIVCILCCFYLPGAGFFIIPVWFGLFMMAHNIFFQKPKIILHIIFSIPVLFLFVPLLQMFPVGLGLKILFVSCILVSIIFGLMQPVFGNFDNKKWWSFASFVVFFGFIIQAHLNSDYEFGKAKPNSLLYIQDADRSKANWVTYDNDLDVWTKKFFSKTNLSEISIFPLSNKYNTGFTFTSNAKTRKIPPPTIQFLKDSIVAGKRFLKILISPNRKVNRYDIFAPENLQIKNFKANNTKSISGQESNGVRDKKHFLRYYVVDNEPLLMEFQTKSNQNINMELLESSFDLLENSAFKIPKRKEWMIPSPFVLTDAVIIKQKIKPTNLLAKKDSLLPIEKKRIFKKRIPATVSDTLKKT
jgi:hypothetical protein